MKQVSYKAFNIKMKWPGKLEKGHHRHLNFILDYNFQLKIQVYSNYKHDWPKTDYKRKK